MREPPEIIEVAEERIACDGGDTALGHPRVFLTLGDDGVVECPYCDRRYVRAGMTAGAARPVS